MKNKYLIFIFFFVAIPSFIHAQTQTVSPTPTIGSGQAGVSPEARLAPEGGMYQVSGTNQESGLASIVSSLQSILLSLKQLITASYHKLPSVSPTTQLAQISGAGSGLVAHYTFDEGSGTTAGDSSGNGNTGTLTNGPTWTTGKVGSGAVSFDGTNDVISITDVPTLNFGASGSFSVSFWTKPNEVTGNFIAKIASSLADGWRFYRFSGTLFRFFVRETGGDDTSTGVIATMTAGKWTHVVGVVNRANNTMYLYFDGVSVGTPTNISGVGDLSTTGTNLHIGSYRVASGDYVNGSLDDVRIYNRALTPAEINELYALGTGGGTVNLSPTARISASPTTGVAPLAVSFNGSTSSDSDGTISSYAWNFGDGQTGSSVTLSHTYTTAGTYTATLTVTDNQGATNATTQTITVTSAPTTSTPTPTHLP